MKKKEEDNLLLLKQRLAELKALVQEINQDTVVGYTPFLFQEIKNYRALISSIITLFVF